MHYFGLACVVVGALFVVKWIYEREHMVDETRTVDYPIYEDKTTPLESNPDRTPDEVPQTGEPVVVKDPVDGQIKNVDPVGWSIENDFMI